MAEQLALLPGFREDPEWIVEQLRPRVSAADVKRALRHLETLGLLVRNDGGGLIAADRKLTTPERVPSLAVRML